MKRKIVYFWIITAIILGSIQTVMGAASDLTLLNPNDVTTNEYLGESVMTLAAVHTVEQTTTTAIYYNINDDVVCGNPDRYAFQIDVDYYDGGKGGYFYLTYDGVDNSNKRCKDYGSVFGTPNNVTGSKRTKTFILYDAAFNNSMQDGADFSITANLYDVNIFDVRIKKLDYKSPVQVSGESDNLGNIFFDGDEKKMNIRFKNTSDAPQNFTSKYTVLNEDNSTVDDVCESFSMSVGAKASVYKPFSIPVSKYGCYILKVEISGGINGNFEIPFSLAAVNTTSTHSNRLGVAAHAVRVDEVREPELLDKIGIGNVRYGISWDSFETRRSESGEFGDENDNPKFNEEALYPKYMEELYKRGIQTTICVGGTSENYKDKDGERAKTYNLPDCDSQRKAYARAVAALLDMQGDKIDAIEIINEPSLNGTNRKGLSASYYAELVNEVYKTVKPQFPNIKFGSYVNGNLWEEYGLNWVDNLFKTDTDNDGIADMAQYSDIYIAHPYVKSWFSKSPTIQTAFKDVDLLKSKLSGYGGADKQIYHTEYGFSASKKQGGTTGVWIREGEKKQASNIIRHTLEMFGKNMGDKFFIYTPSNTGYSENYDEDNYGLTKSVNFDYPYAAKPGLIALSNMNSLIGGCDNCNVVEHDDNKSVFRFSDNDGREVYTFSSENKESYTFKTSNDKFDFYDMYGNAIEVQKGIDGYSLTLSSEPIYAVADNKKQRIGQTIVNGRLLLTAKFNDKKSGDKIEVSVYNNSGELIDKSTHELDDRKTCYINREFDGTTDYIIKFKAESDGYEYTHIINGGMTMNAEASVKDGIMTVSAKFPDGKADDKVALEVTDGGGQALYYDQLCLDNNLECNYSFPVSDAVKYMIRLGTESIKTAYLVNVNGGGYIFSVKKGTTVLKKITELSEGELAPIVNIEMLNDVSGFKLIVAAYTDKECLSNVEIIDSSDMNRVSENENKWTYQLDADKFKGAKTAKFFLMDSIEGFQPLCSEIELN